MQEYCCTFKCNSRYLCETENDESVCIEMGCQFLYDCESCVYHDTCEREGEKTMPSYIEAVEAAEKISEKYSIPLHELVDVFKDIPSANAKEVVYGHWKYNDGLDLECSRCGRLALTPFYSYVQYRSAYCPCCGAKMDGDT